MNRKCLEFIHFGYGRCMMYLVLANYFLCSYKFLVKVTRNIVGITLCGIESIVGNE